MAMDIRVRVRLSRPIPLPWVAPLLSCDEISRCESFKSDARRNESATGAALLRLLVEDELGVDPRSLPVHRSCRDCGKPHGPPRLPPQLGMHASVTHAGRWVGVAVCSQPIGVDIEPHQPRFIDIQDDILTHREKLRVENKSLQDRIVALTSAWTRKEACLKALGVGLRVPLTSLEIVEGVLLKAAGPLSGDSNCFVLRDVVLDSEHAGASTLR